MKKIFTTLSLVALCAGAANAEVTVEMDGKALANGEVIELKASDFKDESFPEIDYYEWASEVKFNVKGSGAVTCNVVATQPTFQFCTSTCFPTHQDGNLYKVEVTEKNSPFSVLIHFNFEAEELPATNEYMNIVFTDSSNEPFTVKINYNGGSGVNHIAGEKETVAVYDLQGHRVADSFKGVGIVVTSDGKASKKIFK